MNKKHILVSISLVILLVISGGFFLKEKKDELKKDNSEEIEELKKNNQEKTITHENGDFIYTPANEEIGYDSEDEVFFYENLLNLFLVSEISNEQATELANVVNGKLVGKIQGSINMLQIQVEAASLNEINYFAERLQKEELVKFAGSSTPSFVSDLNENDTQKASEKVDKPNSDWWAEAIDAYTAWDYIDENKGEFEKVKVAVLESGSLSNEKGKIDDETINKENVEVVNTYDSEYKMHARLVTKIIAANKNKETIRGVAEPIVDIKFISMGDITKEQILEELKNSSKSEAEIISHVKNGLQDGVKIINNSWGTPPMSEENWEEKSNWFEREFIPYHKYLDINQNSNDKVSVQLIIALDELLKSKKDKFLITQSAGNRPLDAKYTGLFTNINKHTYNEAFNLVKGELESNLEVMLSHTIIVGGAELMKGDYKSPDWVSYGEAIDIVAPADNLFDIDKKECEEGYVWGTSYATPMVSGAAALVWSHNPELKASEVKERLLNSAKDNVVEKKGDKHSYPMLNMTAFLNKERYYKSLIETYHKAVTEQWDASTLGNKNLGPTYYTPQPLSKDYGYEIKDINNDGIPEMILGVYREDGRSEIHEIYTLQNKEPVKIFENRIRTNVNIYKDGTIQTCSSVRAGTIIQCMLYKLNSDGTKQGIESNKEYKEIDIIEHTFTPFALEEETDKVVEKNEKK